LKTSHLLLVIDGHQTCLESRHADYGNLEGIGMNKIDRKSETSHETSAKRIIGDVRENRGLSLSNVTTPSPYQGIAYYVADITIDVTTAESDHLYGSTEDDQIYAHSPSLLGDIIETGAGHDWVRGNAGDDIISGGADSDILLGGAGNDRLYADQQTNITDTQTIIDTAIAKGDGAGTGKRGDWLVGDAVIDASYKAQTAWRMAA